MRFVSCLIVFLTLVTLHSRSQILINEICPTNASIITNASGEYDDWFEIYNAGSSAVNLSGYGLTDNPAKPFQFTFPSYTLAAGQKLVVFASDKNTSNIVDHWEMPVNAGTQWKYAPGSASIDTNWRNLSFTASTWLSGSAGIGFGDGDDNTVIPVGPSVMMRKTFTVPDTSQVVKAALLMDYDDGFVAYLNGVEIARANLGTPGFRPAWNEPAGFSHEAHSYRGLALDSFYISPALIKSAIKQGTNVLAIEVHNVTPTSDDLSAIPYLFFGMRTPGLTYIPVPFWFHTVEKEYFSTKFKLDRYGETVYLNNPAGITIDQKAYPAIDIDNSYCRIPDGSSNWCYVNTPTPGASNNTSTCYSNYASAPVFSRQGGYYTSTQSITLMTSTPGGIIRYTINGNTPTATSPAYTGPITVSSTRTIRAKVFANGYLPGPMVTNTYIINGSTKLSTFTITTDSANLWDYNTGIYVLGPNAASTSPYKGANFWQDWEKPASIEYYDKNKNQVVKFDADLSIYGNYSRAKPQKSFEIKLRDRYGMNSFIYPMYSDKTFIDKVDNILLRNSGTDWNKVHFRDAFMQRIMKNTYSGFLAAEPAIAYLNGQYWGVYHINENHDQHWMKNNFGLDKKEIDYLRESGTSINVKEGSDETFWTLYNYATTQNPATTQYYDYVDARLDMQNYADYFIAETFYNNGDWIGDWTNNIKMWRPNDAGAKWRYLLYDTDYGMGLKGDVTDNRLSMARNPAAFSYSSEMFDAILKNPKFKTYFINRYCDLMNTIFLSSNVNTVMKSFKDSMSFDMPAHFAKWGNSVSYWNSEINDMMTWASSRLGISKNQIKAEFQLSGIVKLTIQASPIGSGRIEISTITPTTLPWTGDYFNGNPVTLTAIPNPGFTFDHWKSNRVITSNNPNQTVTYNFNKDDKITAYFTGSATVAKLNVSEFNYNSNKDFDAGDWIELHNYGTTSLDISGWKIKDSQDNHTFVFPTGTKIPANGYLVIVEDSTKFKSVFPNVNNRIGLLGFNISNAGDQIRIYDYAGALYLSFYYQDLAPWPLEADGDGFTCEIISNTSNPNLGASWFAGCLGGSPGTGYNNTMMVPVAINGSTTFCSGSSIALKSSLINQSTFQWKKNNANISGATDSVYNATQAGSYTVAITNHGCTGITSPKVLTTVSQQPMPVTVSASRCGPGQLTLRASSSDSVYWYDAPSGGNLVATGDSLHLPYVSQTTTYYAKTGLNCASNPVATSASILLAAAAPVINDTSRCGPGIITLIATDTAEIRWYNAGTGGGLLSTGPSFTTNIIESDTSFFLEAGTTCPSSRIEARVRINSTPAPVVSDAARCGNGTVVLNAVSQAPVFWFDDASGGTAIASGNAFTTPYLATSDTFYAEANSGCPSMRMMAIAMVNQYPANPIAADSARCSPGSVNLYADASEQVRWYNAATGGQLLFTGSIFTTPSLASTVTYYAETGDLCKSSRVSVNAIISSQAAVPSVTAGTVCDSGTVTLNAISTQAIYWYDAATGGNLVGSGNTFTTPFITSARTYYAEAGTYCKSSRVAVQASITNTPAIPTATNVSRCGTGSVTLVASGTNTLNWYNATTGGSLLSTGASYTTPSLTSSTTYYVESANGACKSQRKAVQAIVNSLPAAPVTTGASRCDAGSLTLGATSSNTINWFASASGGTSLGSGASFTTPVLNASTTFYAEASNGCASVRTATMATVVATPPMPGGSDVTRCGNGSVVLTAISTEPIAWFASSTGGTSLATGASFTTPSITTTTTYYAEAGTTCKSMRKAIQAIIGSSTSAPAMIDGSNCGPGAITLTANSSSQVTWYDVASGGLAIATGPTFTTPVLSTNKTYYAEAGTGNCMSSRVPVQAFIKTIPAAPVGTSGSNCGPGPVTLFASSPATISWFATATSQNVLGVGSSFLTPSINTNTTYYAVADDGCTSARTPVQAVIHAIPAAPVTTGASRCGSGTVDLTANSPASIEWYNSMNGGTMIGSGSPFTTPALSASATFYAEAVQSGCRSIRSQAQAVINSIPNAPVVQGAARCGMGSLSLTAASTEQLNWYATPTGGTVLSTGSLMNTPSLSTTTTYYVEASGACSSTRVAVIAEIRSAEISAFVDAYRCGAGSVTLMATGTSSSDTMLWYDHPNGSVVGSGNTFHTPFLNNNTTYYVTGNSQCVSEPLAVTATIRLEPVVNLGQDTIAIAGGQSVVLDAGAGFASYAWSTNASTQQISVSGAGNYMVTVTDSYGCSGSDAIYLAVLTAVHSLEYDGAVMQAYPNPATDKITIEFNDKISGNIHIKLVSMDGKIVRTDDVSKSSGSFSRIYSLSGIASGMYMLVVENEKYSSTIRVIVE